MNVLMCLSTLSLSIVPVNDKKALENRALSLDRDDEGLGEPGLEDVLKSKRPKGLKKGNLCLSNLQSNPLMMLTFSTFVTNLFVY